MTRSRRIAAFAATAAVVIAIAAVGHLGRVSSFQRPATANLTSGARGAPKPAIENPLAVPSASEPTRHDYTYYRNRERRRMVMAVYSAAVAHMHLSPQKARRLEQLLIEEYMEKGDAKAVAQREGVSPDKAESESLHDVHRQMAALLGDQAQEFWDCQGVLDDLRAGKWPKKSVDGYSVDLHDAGLDLTEQQANELAFLDYRFRSSGEAQRGEPDPATGLSPEDRDELAAMSTLLSADQIEIMKEHFIEKHRATNAYRSHYEAMKTEGRSP